MAPKKLTIIERTSGWIKSWPISEQRRYQRAHGRTDLCAQPDALAAGLPFNINIDEEDLKESESGRRRNIRTIRRTAELLMLVIGSTALAQVMFSLRQPFRVPADLDVICTEAEMNDYATATGSR